MREEWRRLLETLEQAARPLMMRECAEKLGLSLPTNAKVVAACEAAGLVRVTPRATMREVDLTTKGRNWLASQRG